MKIRGGRRRVKHALSWVGKLGRRNAMSSALEGTTGGTENLCEIMISVGCARGETRNTPQFCAEQ